MSEEGVKVVEGLALGSPGRSRATVYREWLSLAKAQGWEEVSYRTVCRIIKELGGAELTMGQKGEKAYREEYDLVSRRSAKRPK